MTQTELIRKHLLEGKPITPIEALNKFNCFRLSARIYELRNQEMNIISRTITSNGKSFAEYRAKSTKQEFITTTEKTDKRGNKYYTQEFSIANWDYENNFTEEIIWKGRAKKEDYEWCKMIAKTQPQRLVMNEMGILTIATDEKTRRKKTRGRQTKSRPY